MACPKCLSAFHQIGFSGPRPFRGKRRRNKLEESMNKWRVMLWKVSQRTGAARSSSVNASLSKVLKIFTARRAQLCRHLSTPLKSSDELSATRRAAADVAGRSVNGKDREAGFKHGGNGLATVVLIWIILFDCIRVASSWLLFSHFVDFIKHLCYLLCNLVFSVLCAAAITRWHEFQTKQEHFPPGYMIGLADMLTVHISLCCQCI